jgi:hypothetical protein
MEELVAGIWREVLGRKQIGLQENFFEIGGHSLLATQVISRVRQVSRRELPLKALFEAPTIADLSRKTEEALRSGGRPPSIVSRANRRGDLPLSYAQERLWFLYQMDPGGAAYNVPGTVRIKGALEVKIFERAMKEIVRRHEVLRTRFEMRESGPVQVIDEAVEMEVGVLDLRGVKEEEREKWIGEMTKEEAQKPFDLSRGPLLRMQLVQVGEKEHVLFFTMHHIVADGRWGFWCGSLGSCMKSLAAGKLRRWRS